MHALSVSKYCMHACPNKLGIFEPS